MEPIILKETPTHRVVAQNILWDGAPEDEGIVPQMTLASERLSSFIINGEMLPSDTIQDAAERFQFSFRNYGWSPVFTRWAKVFYGVNVLVFTSRGYSQGDVQTIIAWPSKEWTELAGVPVDYTPINRDVEDLDAYLWGDTYVLDLEEKVTWTSDKGGTYTDWERTDSHGLFHTRTPENFFYYWDFSDVFPDLETENV